MPLFISEEELLRCDASSVAAKADEVILDLRRQLETLRAEVDASSIATDQTYNVLEQRYASLSAELALAHAECSRLSSAADQSLADLDKSKSANHELHNKLIEKDAEIERQKVELAALQKSNRQLLDLIARNDTEIGEKNALVQSYFDKIVKLTENMNEKESRLQLNEAEMNRSRASCARLLQEKELLEKHNKWLNEELTDKVNDLLDLRRMHMEFEADMSTKIAEAERKYNGCSRSLEQSEAQVKEYVAKLTRLEEDLNSCNDAAVDTERRYSTELSTATKLIELYKESSETWSKKAGDLEGVIKALETHLSQVESDFKSKLEEETSIRKCLEKDVQDLNEKLDKCETELEKERKTHGHDLLLGSSLHDDVQMEEVCLDDIEFGNSVGNNVLDVPRKPAGISGTALAASLLREGWSLAKMYEKYQEAADALRHEKWGRKHTEAVLERVLHEIEGKAAIILEERVEHEKMAAAYTLLNQKLLDAQTEHEKYEASVRNLKAEVKQLERNSDIIQKENVDLEHQVSVLLKECRDIQLRCGISSSELVRANSDSEVEDVDVNRLSFRDIFNLVQQNSQLKSLVHSLSSAEEARLCDIRDNLQMELQKKENETLSKVEAVLKRCEEQGVMIESLHSSVALYKKLYEEEHRSRRSGYVSSEVLTDGNKDILVLFEESQDVARKAHEEVLVRARSLEQELSNLRNELLAMQLERDKFAMEAKLAKERLDRAIIELDRQKNESNGISARNVELSQLIIDYQRKVQENKDLLHASEERYRQLSVEVSVLKSEKELFLNSEKRAFDEIQSSTERAYRLQSSLDTMQGMEQVREESRLRERRKLEEQMQQIEKEWAEAKRELQQQRDHARVLDADRERAVEESMRQINEMRKELSDAWHAVSSAESRAAVAEERYSQLEALMKNVDKAAKDGKDTPSSTLMQNEEVGNLWKLHEEMDQLKEEAEANRSYMMQYKEIARINEAALKQVESSHEDFKSEAEKLRCSLESEIKTLRKKVADLETECMVKANDAFAANFDKESAISAAASDVDRLKEQNSLNIGKILELESQVYSLKENLDSEHERWRTSQSNYERQVVLQSETIQELTRTSEALASLQNELMQLRAVSDALKSENELLKTSLQAERSSLVKEKEEAERKFREIEEQNGVLHKRLESMHLKYMEKGLSLGGVTASNDVHAENDLQTVISYVRRAREIAETENSLLRQEKLRLQSQLDMALKSSEKAQALLHVELENAKARPYSDDEFNSLKLQVQEINLLRESNAELRAENKYNFEECRRLREVIQNGKVEYEQLAKDRDVAEQVYQKEITTLKDVKMKLEQEISELNGKFKGVDIAEIERMKDELHHTRVKLRERESDADVLKGNLMEREKLITELEEKLSKCEKDLDEHQRKISSLLLTEKKVEQLLKEKDDLRNENQLLNKRLEESLAGKRIDSGTNEDATKEMEKDTRMQLLEKRLERQNEQLRKEKEENKKEKAKRMKNEKLLIDHAHIVIQEKRKLEDEIKTLKLSICSILENSGVIPSQLASESGLEERSVAYFFAVDKYEETANSVLGDGSSLRAPSTDSPPMEAATSTPAQENTGAPTRSASSVAPEKDLSKMNVDGRKMVRRINRPRLKQSEQSVIDTEILEMDGTTSAETKLIDSREEEVHVGSHSHKRLTSSMPDLQEEMGSEAAPLSKKVKGLESSHQVLEMQVTTKQSTGGSTLVEDIAPKVAEIAEQDTNEKLIDTDSWSKEELDKLKDVGALETDVNVDSDPNPPSPDKSVEGLLRFNETTKADEALELSETALDEQIEEGEMAPDEMELQVDEGESAQPEPIAVEAGSLTDTDEATEAATPSDFSNIVDEIPVYVPGKTMQDQSASDNEDGQFTTTTGLPHPSDITVDSPASEQALPGIQSEPGESQAQTTEPEGSRTSGRITITERARQNALLRQAGMATRASARGTPRGVFRRDIGRGRGGRGANFGDREQQG